MTEHPRLSPDVLRREVEDELLLYDPRTGETLLLNVTAACVAELCDGTRDHEAIVRAIASIVPGTETSILATDVERALAELRAAGMIEGGP
jgi:PqqD family protein of HPr-rel-A system